MKIDQDLLNRITEAVTANRVATKEDLIENYRNEIVVRSDRVAYFNPRVTMTVDNLSTTEVTHLKFIPLRRDGVVVIAPAEPNEIGATEFTRGESRRTGMINLRVALNGFQLETMEGRKLTFPVQVQEIAGPDGTKREVLVLQVKRPESKKSQVRPRKKKAEAAKADQKPEQKAEPKAEQKPQQPAAAPPQTGSEA